MGRSFRLLTPLALTLALATFSANAAAPLWNPLFVGGGQRAPVSGAPTLLGLSPNNGLTSCPVQVTLTGTNFAAPATVTFGGVTATGVQVLNPTTILATSPNGSVGAVNVLVQTPGGTSAPGPQFTRAAHAPTLSGINPTSQLFTASPPVAEVLSGGWFDCASAVTFTANPGGTQYSAPFTINQTGATSSISAQLPPSLPTGNYNVSVTTPNSTSGSAAFAYNLPPAPAVSGVTPPQFGTLPVNVMIAGQWFDNATQVGLTPVGGGSTTILPATTFTGSTSGNVLTVSSTPTTTLFVGATLSGVGVPAGTIILSQTGGTTGGIGTYTISSSPSPISPQTMNATSWAVTQIGASGAMVATMPASLLSGTTYYVQVTTWAPSPTTCATNCQFTPGSAPTGVPVVQLVMPFRGGNAGGTIATLLGSGFGSVTCTGPPGPIGVQFGTIWASACQASPDGKELTVVVPHCQGYLATGAQGVCTGGTTQNCAPGVACPTYPVVVTNSFGPSNNTITFSYNDWAQEYFNGVADANGTLLGGTELRILTMYKIPSGDPMPVDSFGLTSASPNWAQVLCSAANAQRYQWDPSNFGGGPGCWTHVAGTGVWLTQGPCATPPQPQVLFKNSPAGNWGQDTTLPSPYTCGQTVDNAPLDVTNSAFVAPFATLADGTPENPPIYVLMASGQTGTVKTRNNLVPTGGTGAWSALSASLGADVRSMGGHMDCSGAHCVYFALAGGTGGVVTGTLSATAPRTGAITWNANAESWSDDGGNSFCTGTLRSCTNKNRTWPTISPNNYCATSTTAPLAPAPFVNPCGTLGQATVYPPPGMRITGIADCLNKPGASQRTTVYHLVWGQVYARVDRGPVTATPTASNPHGSYWVLVSVMLPAPDGSMQSGQNTWTRGLSCVDNVDQKDGSQELLLTANNDGVYRVDPYACGFDGSSLLPTFCGRSSAGWTKETNFQFRTATGSSPNVSGTEGARWGGGNTYGFFNGLDAVLNSTWGGTGINSNSSINIYNGGGPTEVAGQGFLKVGNSWIGGQGGTGLRSTPPSPAGRSGYTAAIGGVNAGLWMRSGAGDPFAFSLVPTCALASCYNGIPAAHTPYYEMGILSNNAHSGYWGHNIRAITWSSFPSDWTVSNLFWGYGASEITFTANAFNYPGPNGQLLSIVINPASGGGSITATPDNSDPIRPGRQTITITPAAAGNTPNAIINQIANDANAPQYIWASATGAGTGTVSPTSFATPLTGGEGATLLFGGTDRGTSQANNSAWMGSGPISEFQGYAMSSATLVNPGANCTGVLGPEAFTLDNGTTGVSISLAPAQVWATMGGNKQLISPLSILGGSGQYWPTVPPNPVTLDPVDGSCGTNPTANVTWNLAPWGQPAQPPTYPPPPLTAPVVRLGLDPTNATPSGNMAVFGTAADVCAYSTALCPDATPFFARYSGGLYEATRLPEASTRARIISGAVLANNTTQAGGALGPVATALNNASPGTGVPGNSMNFQWDGYTVSVCWGAGAGCPAATGTGCVMGDQSFCNNQTVIINNAIAAVPVGTLQGRIDPVQVTGLTVTNPGGGSVVASVSNTSGQLMYAGGNLCSAGTYPCLSDHIDPTTGNPNTGTLVPAPAQWINPLLGQMVFNTPTGPLLGDGNYSFYAPIGPVNITNGSYTYGIMTVYSVTPDPSNPLLTPGGSLTPFIISDSAHKIPLYSNKPAAVETTGDYIFQCIQNCPPAIPSSGSPSKWIVSYPGDGSGVAIPNSTPGTSETITLNLPPAIVDWKNPPGVIRLNPQGAANCCVPLGGQVRGDSGYTGSPMTVGFANGGAAQIFGWTKWLPGMPAPTSGVAVLNSGPVPAGALNNTWSAVDPAGAIVSSAAAYMENLYTYSSMGPGFYPITLPFSQCFVNTGTALLAQIQTWASGQSPAIQCTGTAGQIF